MPVTAFPRRSPWKRFGAFLAALGPGLFLVGYNIGTGSLTTMAVAGADYGMALVWPLLLSCVFTYVLIVAFGRYTAITGKTSLASFREHFGRGPSLFVLGALVFTELVSSMGVMAVVTEVVQDWSRPLTASKEGFSQVAAALVFATLLYLLFLNGRYRFFEKVLALFVGIMGLSFLLTMFMVIPDASDVMEGLVPRIPETTNASLLIAGMVGTTMGGVLYIVRSILVKEKGWTITEVRLERRDAFVSSALMFVLSIAIMACAAGTLYPAGLHVESAIDMVDLLEPLAGRFAISIFVAGIICAGLSSIFPQYLLVPWLLADYSDTPVEMRATRTRVIVLFVASLGLIVPLFGGRPVLFMIMSQALLIVVTPLIIVLMIILQNKRSVMGTHRPPPWMNALMGIILSFSVLMAIAGVVGLLGML